MPLLAGVDSETRSSQAMVHDAVVRASLHGRAGVRPGLDVAGAARRDLHHERLDQLLLDHLPGV